MNSPENNARDIDLHIDHALAALRNAHPRADLDRRILHALEERASSTHRSRTALRLSPSLPLAAWVASGALALAILAAFLLPHHARRMNETRVAHPFANSKGWGRDANITTNPIPSATVTLTEPTDVSSRPEHRSLIAMRSGETGVPGQLAGRGAQTCSSDHPRSGCPIHDDGLIVVMNGVTQAHTLKAATAGARARTPSEAILLADLHAPSHPAPPLPLTPQEKALLRMLRYSNATQLASLADLNPTVRSARDAAEAADFHDFFNPPLPIQPDGDTE